MSTQYSYNSSARLIATMLLAVVANISNTSSFSTSLSGVLFAAVTGSVELAPKSELFLFEQQPQQQPQQFQQQLQKPQQIQQMHLLQEQQPQSLSQNFDAYSSLLVDSHLSNASFAFAGNHVSPFHRKIDRLVEVSYLYRTIVAVIYFVTAAFAFVVNFFALLILVYGPRKSGRQLNRFLSNLGFSDIIFAIFNIPFTYITLIYNTWWLPEFLCPVTNFVQVLAPTVAFYTLIAIGIGRYFVIVTGHESTLLSKSSHTKVVIASIWIISVAVAFPTLLAAKTSPVSYGNETDLVECIEDWSFLDDPTHDYASRLGAYYTIIVFVLTFILPVVALTYLYGHIGIIVYKHQLPVGNENRVMNRNLTQTKIKVVKMLLLLVISFIVCWSPSQIFYLMLWFVENIRQDTTNTETTDGGSSNYSLFYYTLFFMFHWLSCSHTIINPFIYCFFSNNFRKSDLLAILRCHAESSGPRTHKSMNPLTNSATFNPGISINRRCKRKLSKSNTASNADSIINDNNNHINDEDDGIHNNNNSCRNNNHSKKKKGKANHSVVKLKFTAKNSSNKPQFEV